MKIGIVGNRSGWDYITVKATLMELGLYKSDMIISGGSDGVDTFAQMIAKEIGSEMVIFYPDPSKPSPQRYFDRNKEIALRCDVLVAFDRGSSSHSGTLNTINYAKKEGKTVIVVSDEGSYVTFNSKGEA
jgi:predicted Rossmann fold nucleotide-binding protein DprA/Smf involved in DNA uptake